MGWSLVRRMISVTCTGVYIFLSPYTLGAETKSAHSKEWLGSYIGSQIPGYEVKKSILVSSAEWGAVDEMIKSASKSPLTGDLMDTCQTALGGGIALVNIRNTIVLGPVPRLRSALNTIIPNGMYRVLEGDCVIEAVPLPK